MMKAAADVKIGDQIGQAGYVAGIERLGKDAGIRLYLRTVPNGPGGRLLGRSLGTLPLLPGDHVSVTR